MTLTDEEIEVYATQMSQFDFDYTTDGVKLIGHLEYEDTCRVLQRTAEISRKRFEAAADEYWAALDKIRTTDRLQ